MKEGVCNVQVKLRNGHFVKNNQTNDNRDTTDVQLHYKFVTKLAYT